MRLIVRMVMFERWEHLLIVTTLVVTLFISSNNVIAQEPCELTPAVHEFMSKTINEHSICNGIREIYITDQTDNIQCDEDGVYYSPKEDWLISVKANRPQQIPGLKTYNITLIGPSKAISGFKGVGFEKYVIHLTQAYTARCAPTVITNVHLPLYNVRSFTELHELSENQSNNKMLNSSDSIREDVQEPIDRKLSNIICDSIEKDYDTKCPT